jgi:hypothetical protein
MAAERFIYVLADWTVEKRESDWYFARSANRHNKGDWKEPYSSVESVAMMIARQLRKEIVERYERQRAARSAA